MRPSRLASSYPPPPSEDRAKIEGLVRNQGPTKQKTNHQDGQVGNYFNHFSYGEHCSSKDR